MDLCLGKRVNIGDKCSGVVRYIGPVKGKEGDWVGLELDEALGTNDGSYEGNSYFSCKKGYGLFVATKRLEHEMTKKGMRDSGKDESHKWTQSNQSLFIEDLEPKRLGAVVDREIRILEDENKVLKETADNYRKMFYMIAEKATVAIKKIKSDLVAINERIERMKKRTVPSSEKERVVNLVREIYYGEKKRDKTRVVELFREFKAIMDKNNIKVEDVAI